MILSKLRVDTDFEEPVFVEYILNLTHSKPVINIKEIISDISSIFICIVRCYSFHYELNHLITDELLVQQVYDDVMFKLSKSISIYGYEIELNNVKEIFDSFTRDY